MTDDGATPLSPYLMTLFVSVMHRADKCVGAMRGSRGDEAITSRCCLCAQG